MDNRRDCRIDQASGVFWILFGGVIVIMSLNMRLDTRLGATFLTGPGLVPMMLGVAFCVLGVVLILRGLRGKLQPFLEHSGDISEGRALSALALLLVFSIGLVGHIPFGIATFLFITAFIVIFNLPVSGPKPLIRLVAKAAITGAITAVTVVFVFENLFYVRLP